MDEEQLQTLWNLHAKDAGFKDINEFKALMQNDNARKVYFDNSNRQLGFKDYNDFNLTLKKKEPTQSGQTSGVQSSEVSGISGDQLKKAGRDMAESFAAKAEDHKITPEKVDVFNSVIEASKVHKEAFKNGIAQIPSVDKTNQDKAQKQMVDALDKLHKVGMDQTKEQESRNAEKFIFKPEQKSEFEDIANNPEGAALQMASQFNRAIVSTAASLPKSVAILAKPLDKFFGIQDKPTEEYGTYKAGQWLEDKALEWGLTATDPDRDQSFWQSVVPNALGSVMAIILTGGAGEATGMESMAMTGKQAVKNAIGDTGKLLVKPSTIAGSTATAVPEFENAKMAGLSDEQALGVWAKNYFVGATEILPIQNALGRINKLSGGKIVDVLKAGTVGGIEEGVQETVQQLMTNKIASGTYDPSRDLFQDVIQNGAAGFFVGFLLPGIGKAMQHMSPEQQQQTKEVIHDELQKYQEQKINAPSGDLNPIEQPTDNTQNASGSESETQNEPQNGEVNQGRQEGRQEDVLAQEASQVSEATPTPQEPTSPEEPITSNEQPQQPQAEDHQALVERGKEIQKESEDIKEKWLTKAGNFKKSTPESVVTRSKELQAEYDALREKFHSPETNVDFTDRPFAKRQFDNGQLIKESEKFYNEDGTPKKDADVKEVQSNYDSRVAIEKQDYREGRYGQVGSAIAETKFENAVEEINNDFNGFDIQKTSPEQETKSINSEEPLQQSEPNPITEDQFVPQPTNQSLVETNPIETKPIGAKKLSVISRTNEDVSKIVSEVFDGTYDPQSNRETVAKTKEFITKMGGIDNAYAARNLVHGAVKRVVYAEYMDNLQNKLNEDPGNVTLLRNAMIEFATLAKESGQAIQIMDHIYDEYGSLFTAERQLEKFAANTQDGVVPEKIKAQLEDITKRYQELSKEVDRLEKVRQEHEDQVSMFNIKESIKREKNTRAQRGHQTIKEAQNLREKLKKDFAKTSKGGALQGSFIGITSEQFAIVVNIAKTYIDELAGNVDLAIAKTLEFLKESGHALTPDQIDSLKKEIDPILTIDEVKVPNSMLRNLVKNGYDTIEKLTPKVKEVLENMYPTLTFTERKVRDIISGYGRTVNQSEDQIQATISKIKIAGQLKSKLEELIQGKRPLKSGYQRNKDLTKEEKAEIRAKTRYINQLLKDLPLDEATQENELRTAMDAALARLKNREEDLKFAISKGGAIKNVSKDISSQEIEEQKQVTKDVKDIYDSVFDDESATDNVDRVIKSLNLAVDKMKDRIDHVDGELFKAKKDKISTPDIESLRDRMKRLREFRNFLLEDSGALEVKRLQSLINSAKKTEERLKQSIKTGDFSKRVVKNNYIGYNVADDEAELARQKEILKSAETTEQRKAIQLNIDVLTKKIQSVKDLLKKRGELRGIKDEAVKIQYAQELANRAAEHKALVTSVELAFNITRAMKAGFDMSIAGIQLMLPNIYFARKDAVNFAKSLVQGGTFKSQSKEHFKQGLKALLSEGEHKAKTQELSQHKDYELAKDVGLKVSVGNPKLEAEEEALMYAAFSKISGLPNKAIGELIKKSGAKDIGEFIKNSNIPQSFERASHAMANVVRLNRFSELADRLRKEGKTPFANREEFKEIAKYVNDSSGAAGLGAFESVSKVAPYFLFSARLISQAIKYATPYAMVHYYKLGNSGQSTVQRFNPFTSSVAQRAFMEDYVYAIGIQFLIMQSVVAAVNLGISNDDDKWSIEKDPRSSSFMQIRIPGKDGKVTYVEPWGPYRTMIVFMARMMTGDMKRRNGELLKLGEGMTPTRLALMRDFAFNKVAPTPSFVAKAFDVHYKFNEDEGTYTTKDAYGNEYEFDQEVALLAFPMYFSTISEGFQSQNPALAAGLTATAFFGLGVNTYDESPKEEE